MNRELLSKAFGEIDEGYIAEAYRPAPEDAIAFSERMVRMKKKRMITSALAAALMLALGITAYAAWSIHASRQRELREDLKIDENNVSSYVNISPVSEEEAAAYMETVWFTCGIDGTGLGGNAVPALPEGQALSGSEEMSAAVLQHAYDKETQTLTLQCFLDVNSALQAMQTLGSETLPLSIHMFVDGNMARSFGPIPFALTEEQLRVFDFGHAVYHDAELNKDIEIVGLDLTPFGLVWKVHYEGDAEVQRRKYDDWEAYKPWCDLEEKVCREAKIIFSDGSEFSAGGSLNSCYENGTVNLWYSWLRAIDIDDVQRIVIGDQVLWEAE